jgi:hypothetical protein
VACGALGRRSRNERIRTDGCAARCEGLSANF